MVPQIQTFVTIASLLFAASGTYAAERALDRYARIPDAAQAQNASLPADDAEPEADPAA